MLPARIGRGMPAEVCLETVLVNRKRIVKAGSVLKGQGDMARGDKEKKS